MRSPLISVLLAVVFFPASRYICAADLTRIPTVEEKAVAILLRDLNILMKREGLGLPEPALSFWRST